MGLRVKITDQMVEAAIASIYDDAVVAGHPPPNEADAPWQWSEMRRVTRRALAAAASTLTLEEPK